VFWPYGADEFVPTEELYQTAEDPLELTNLASAASHRVDLDTMRTVYDRAVGRWKEEAVPYHRYQPFGIVFDRHVPWSEKQKFVKGK
jgi:hypothetical protein